VHPAATGYAVHPAATGYRIGLLGVASCGVEAGQNNYVILTLLLSVFLREGWGLCVNGVGWS